MESIVSGGQRSTAGVSASEVAVGPLLGIVVIVVVKSDQIIIRPPLYSFSAEMLAGFGGKTGFAEPRCFDCRVLLATLSLGDSAEGALAQPRVP